MKTKQKKTNQKKAKKALQQGEIDYTLYKDEKGRFICGIPGNNGKNISPNKSLTYMSQKDKIFLSYEIDFIEEG